ncbi:MAG: sulfurtransferase TusA family protein [Chloroflexota bacterium]
MIEVDARGYSCPIPVVKTKKAIDANKDVEIVVLVDSAVARENVARIAKSQGYTVEISELEDNFRLLLSPSARQKS